MRSVLSGVLSKALPGFLLLLVIGCGWVFWRTGIFADVLKFLKHGSVVLGEMKFMK
jgi:hypothetical protein